MNLIEVKNITVSYENHKVIKDLSFEVKNKDYICILGENGSGKSTLIKTILGLKNYSKGKIEFPNLNKKEIGYLPQQSTSQKDFPASVYEIVISGCINNMGLRPFYSKEQKELAIESLKRLNILNLKNRCYRELSGGQQQRVLLARSLCATKKIILLDEPVAGLDPKATKDLYNIIDKLNKEGITIIMVSHDIDEAIKHCNKILYLGKHKFFGTTEEYLNDEHCDCFGGDQCD